jgi:ABC-type spermidine/putrescine transport system permease subunit I
MIGPVSAHQGAHTLQRRRLRTVGAVRHLAAGIHLLAGSTGRAQLADNPHNRQRSPLGLHNDARLFSDPHFAQTVCNNLVYTCGTIVPSLTLALLFALGLRETTRFAVLLRIMIVLPLLIPVVAAAALFIFIFLPGGGLLDYYLARLDLAGTNWLRDPRWRSARSLRSPYGRTPDTTCCSSLPGLQGYHRNCGTRRKSMPPVPGNASSA